MKLAWTRHLLKFRTELADVFANGDYEPLKASGPHRDHIIAFARRRGPDAAIVAVAKSFAAFSQGGRAWPRAESYDARIHIGGYAVEGFADADASELRLSDLFKHLPAAGQIAALKDRLRADLDYQVNLKAQHEIMQLHHKLDSINQRLDALSGAPAPAAAKA